MLNFTLNHGLELRLLELQHAESIFHLVDNERIHLRKWLPWVDGTVSIVETQEFIRDSANRYAARNGFQMGIWNHGNPIGIIGLHKIDWANQSSSIGYWLSERCQGKGIMTQACMLLVQYVLQELGLHRIEIRCAEENFKSRAIPERLGFTKEGTIRDAEFLYNHYVNYVVYGLLAGDLGNLQQVNSLGNGHEKNR